MKENTQGNTRSVRLERETAHLAKLAATAAREALSDWLAGAVKQRLEREGKLPARLRVRETTVEFHDEGDGYAKTDTPSR